MASEEKPLSSKPRASALIAIAGSAVLSFSVGCNQIGVPSPPDAAVDAGPQGDADAEPDPQGVTDASPEEDAEPIGVPPED